MIITSQGASARSSHDDRSAKERIVALLQPIAQSAGYNLVPVSTADLETGSVPASASGIPVLHYGIQGTNAFADYDVLIEMERLGGYRKLYIRKLALLEQMGIVGKIDQGGHGKGHKTAWRLL